MGDRARLTCFMVTFNEAERIGFFLSHATKWADEVIICDKGSTDDTQAIAEKAGAIVHKIPYSEQGRESVRQLIKKYGGEWNLVCTPSDVPTKPLIDQLKTIISEDDSAELDAVLLPRKTYSFGENFKSSPWGVCYIPNAINKRSERIGEKVHILIDGDAKVKTVDYTEESHILHQTHSSPEGFLRSHVEYALKTCQDDKEKAYNDSIRALGRLRDKFNLRLRRSAQFHAWRMYHHAICLTAKTSDQAERIRLMYRQRAKEYAEKNWKG